jgi:SAM-dependent methyltransferase
MLEKRMKFKTVAAILALVLVLATALWAWQRGHHPAAGGSESPPGAPPQWAIPELLRDYEVIRHADPHQVMAQLDVAPGSIVADIGAGLGFYTRRLSLAVGATGKVIATETDPFLLSLLLDRIENSFPAVAALHNVVPRWVNQEGIGLRPNSVDLAFLGHLGCYLSPGPAATEKEFLESLYEVVRPGGRVAVLQWLYYLWGSDDPAVGSSPPEVIRDRIVANYLAVGFELDRIADTGMPENVSGYKKAQYHTMEETFTSTLILLRKPLIIPPPDSPDRD